VALAAIAVTVALWSRPDGSSRPAPASGAADSGAAKDSGADTEHQRRLDASADRTPPANTDISAPVAARVAAKPPSDARARRPKKRRARHRGTGWLSINATPWAIVYLDGKRLGLTPMFRRVVPAGRHRLELRNPDRKLVRKLWIVVKKGEELRRAIRLEE
jgi:serine/threonine-protein kinase